MKRKLILISILLLVIILAFSYGFKNKPVVKNTIEPSKVERKVRVKEQVVTDQNTPDFHTWNDLGITPFQVLEGGNYVFTAFDYDYRNKELIIAGNYDSNKIKFIKDKLITELEINDIPLDILYKNDVLYVLCLSKFYLIKDKTIQLEFNHNINSVNLFDKLISFDGYINVLMSDGSSYKLSNNEFEHTKSLLTNNNEEIWIQKTSSKSFEVKTLPKNDELNATVNYTNDIGAIFIFGENSENHYCIIDMLKSTNPINYGRFLISSKNKFTSPILELPLSKYTYIKNDIKIHNNTLYTAFASNEGVTIQNKELP